MYIHNCFRLVSLRYALVAVFILNWPCVHTLHSHMQLIPLQQHLLKVKKNKEAQKASYAKIAAIDINTTRDSGIELEVAEDEVEKTNSKEIKETSLNIIIHGVEELMDMDPKEINTKIANMLKTLSWNKWE